MEKPFSMLCMEFKQELANLINNSGLPPFVIESVIQNYLNELSGISKAQYLSDKSQYEKFLYNESNKNVDVSNCVKECD